ncbi:MAG: hypothetical protein AMK70_10100 [Nitrospira bacterium SG8_35_1]|nr:MAG: hypothetical protein AMK70_10100 [Nitrospira bacterium SG8_35_1]
MSLRSIFWEKSKIMNMLHSANIEIKSVKNLKGPRDSFRQRHKFLIRALIFLFFFPGLLFAAKLTYHRLCECDFFQITAVKIDGNRMTSKEQIAALSRVDIHSNLLAIDPDQIRSLLEMINLKEKNPVALLNRETGLFYLDSRGRIIAAARPSQELDLPVITGLENYPFDSTQAAQIPVPLLDVFDLLKSANRNNPILPQQNISEIHIAEKGELILYLLDRPFPIYLGKDGKISTRYSRLVKVLKDLYKTKEFSEVSYIRFDYQKGTILVGKHDAQS